jgi:hypothetical protein
MDNFQTDLTPTGHQILIALPSDPPIHQNGKQHQRMDYRKNKLNLFRFLKNLPMNQTHVERGWLKEY